ncbi:MAG: hypothetical protein KatS3mg032_2117 [Cyclobacteriaceae bacterium]|nr:MAG: hypothetical protein KatS3mg032_2117 [Cyclobacteriaceae bacterium]
MKHLFKTWCLLTMLTAVAQEPPRREPDLQRLTDELLAFQDEDLNYEELYENLALLMAHPIDINQATAEQLRFFNLLSEEQVQNLIRYREENGKLMSLYELQSIEGFDQTTFERISPFFTVTNTDAPAGISITDNTYTLWRYTRTLQTKAGFTEAVSSNQRFAGSADALYFRWRSAVPGNYSLGLTAEKDTGEAWRFSPSARHYGMDFISPHVQLMNRGRLQNLILGHYQAQVGQGLLLGGNFGFGKGGETVTSVRRSNLGFMPYTSLNETGYLNGIALKVKITQGLSVAPFYSYTWRDASVSADSTEQSFVTTFLYTGLHRNTSELSRRKQISEQQYGGVLQYNYKQLDAGAVINNLRFSKPLMPNPQPYNQFAFNGTLLTNVGFYLNYTFRNFTFFSEAARSLNHGYAWVAGMMGSLTANLDVVWLARNYRPDFYSFYANAFAENSRPMNEQGIYFGWKHRLQKTITLSGYIDLFRFPWLRYRAYAPDTGHEWLLRLSYVPSRTVTLTAQFREESKGRNISGEEGNLYHMAHGQRRNLWLIADYSITTRLRLRTRAQFSSYALNTTTRGMAVLQDVMYRHGRFSITGRYALFDTDDYENRQYVYENDVWLAFSFPALYDKGIRSYLLLEYRLSQALTLWCRAAHTAYANRTETGSGPDRIASPERTDIRLQVRWRF